MIKPLKKEVFSTGLLKMKDSRSYSDHKGTLACWGTDWPVGDTVKYAKETVGLAISLPDDLIRQETEDRYNDLYIIQAEGTKYNGSSSANRNPGISSDENEHLPPSGSDHRHISFH